MSIHPTAIVSGEAEVHEEVEIGPYVVIRGKVRIGKGTKIEHAATIGNDYGTVEIGQNNNIFANSYIGGVPQDLSYKNENTSLKIGDRNIIREFVTINTGTAGSGGCTEIGNDCLIMAYAHLAHDCKLGNHVVVANSCQSAGHTIIEDYVRVGGGCLLSQFITIGKYCFLAGDSTVNKDLLPYSMAQGKYAVMRATNKIGLKRAGYSKEEISEINKAMRFLIKGERTVNEAIEKVKAECKLTDSVKHLIEFAEKSNRGIAR